MTLLKKFINYMVVYALWLKAVDGVGLCWYENILTVNPQVPGSSPGRGARQIKGWCLGASPFFSSRICVWWDVGWSVLNPHWCRCLTQSVVVSFWVALCRHVSAICAAHALKN